MKWMAVLAMLVMVTAGPALAAGLNVENFEVKTTKNLLDLCTVAPEDPMYAQAIHFCHGYLVGAYHYYEASVSGPNAVPIVCLPEKRPTRNETIQMFIEWAKAHPQYWNEMPVETEFRFLTEKWPCPE